MIPENQVIQTETENIQPEFPQNKRSYMSVLLMLFLLIALTFLSLFLYISNENLNKEISLSTFDECAEFEGSTIQESYPAVCITKNGLRFLQQTGNEELFSPPPADNSLPEGWREYKNEELGFIIILPETTSEPKLNNLENMQKLVFENLLTIERGRFYKPNDTTPLSFSQFIEENRPPAKTIINYTLGEIQGRQFTFTRSATKTEYLIAVPAPNAKGVLFTLTYFSDTQSQETIYKILKSFMFTSATERTPKQACFDYNGKWLADYNECEGMEKSVCEEKGGIFEECASPCRHEPEKTVCIQTCVTVCKF